MKKLFDWLDHRTGYRHLIAEALYENIPGGSRWRYVWGSTLAFTFFLQVVTGFFMWMCYSPSTQTAWESVYYLNDHMTLGSFLRSVHYYAAQAMVILMAIHLIQIMIDRAYKAPREVNFWVGLILMQIVLGLALTGYLLPWDQKGYWATKVATEIAGSASEQIPVLAVGGSDYGHHTLTRFFALHAGVLPTLLALFLVIHIAVFRRHGITAHINPKKPGPDEHFWPSQVLKDGVACLLVLVAVAALAWYRPAELMAPANAAENYSAARPEWYFLFLFQFLKYFPGEQGKLIGAIVIPGLVMLIFFLMPFFGRSRFGHRFNITFIATILCGAVVLTGLALHEDYYARLVDRAEFAEIEGALDEVAADLRKNESKSPYFEKSPSDQLRIRYQDDAAKATAMLGQLARYRKFQISEDYLQAVSDAERDAERVKELATTHGTDSDDARPRIPPTGALSLLRDDPKTQGPKLFRRYCLDCHDHLDEAGDGMTRIRPLKFTEKDGKRKWLPNGAPNLYRFASRAWVAGLLDPEKIAAVQRDEETWQVREAPYFGNTKFASGDMTEFVVDTFSDLDEEDQKLRDTLVHWLSAEAELPYQSQEAQDLVTQAVADLPADADDSAKAEAIGGARTEALESFSCFDCHKLGDDGDLGDAPDLTGYGSRQWMIDLISDPSHKRFYGPSGNDRMPAFNPAGALEKQQLTPQKIGLIVDWLREDWHE